MNRKEKKVATLAAKAQEFLIKEDCLGAEVAYKYAFTESVRLLGLRHPSTRNLLSIYTMCLKAVQKHEQALRHEALFWKTGRPESYRLGVLFGDVDSDLREFLDNNADLIEDFGQQISSNAQKRRWPWPATERVLQAVKAYIKRLHVLESGK
jgi:hypothetical protein